LPSFSYLLMTKIFCKIGPRWLPFIKAELDAFFDWTRHLNIPLNLDKCHSMTFCRKRSPLLHSYFLGSSPLLIVHLIKDLGFYPQLTLSFKYHLNITVGKSLEILGFIKRDTTLLPPPPVTNVRTLYFILVRSILKYG